MGCLKMVNEKRLIDANALLEEIQFRRPVIDTETKIVADCVEIARKAIVNAPTVDAVEVVHGRWIVEVDGNFRNVKCSTCGKDYACHTGMLQLQNLNYCPHCGAKMDGDGKCE